MDKQKISQKDKYIYMIKNQQLHTEHDTLHPTQVSISKKKI